MLKMKEIFKKITDRIAEVSDIKFVDIDYGQLTYYSIRPALAWPCALVDISYLNCQNIGDGTQEATVQLTVKLVFEGLGDTYTAAPDAIRDKAFSIFDTVEAVHNKLQAWDGEPYFGELARKSLKPESRSDGLKIFTLVYDFRNWKA